MYKQRSVVSVIIYSFITCGIYYLYWLYITMRDVNNYLEIVDMDSGVELLLCIFCFPYRYYWYYKYSQRLSDSEIKAEIAIRDDSIITLILAIFQLEIVSAALMQDRINKIWASEQQHGY